MPPQTIEIFQRELDAFEELHTDTDCSQREKCKSFLLSALRRASLSVVEESLGEFEMECSNENHGKFTEENCVFTNKADSEGNEIRETTLATARTIVGEINS